MAFPTLDEEVDAIIAAKTKEPPEEETAEDPLAKIDEEVDAIVESKRVSGEDFYAVKPAATPSPTPSLAPSSTPSSTPAPVPSQTPPPAAAAPTPVVPPSPSVTPPPQKPVEETGIPKPQPSRLPPPPAPTLQDADAVDTFLALTQGRPSHEWGAGEINLLGTFEEKELDKLASLRKDLPLTETQQRKLFDYQRKDGVGIPDTAEEWYNLAEGTVDFVAGAGTGLLETAVGGIKGLAKGGYRLGDAAIKGTDYSVAINTYSSLPEDAQARVREKLGSIQGGFWNPKGLPDAEVKQIVLAEVPKEKAEAIQQDQNTKLELARQVPFSFLDPAISLPYSAAELATKIYQTNTGPFGIIPTNIQAFDNIAESMGLQSEDTTYDKWKNRMMFEGAMEQWNMKRPTSYHKFLETITPAIAAISKTYLPTVEDYMREKGITREQAINLRNWEAEEMTLASMEDVEKTIPDLEQDIVMAGNLFTPEGFGLDNVGLAIQSGRLASGLGPRLWLKIKYAGLSPDERNAILKGLQQSQKAKAAKALEKAQQPSAVGKAAGVVDDKIRQVMEAAEKSRTLQAISGLSPYLAGAGVGYLSDPDDPIKILAGALAGRIAISMPEFLRLYDEARMLSAGGRKGTFATMADLVREQNLSAKAKGKIPSMDDVEGVRKRVTLKGGLANRITERNGKMLDDIFSSAGEYVRSGVQPTLAALAVGIADSSDPEELSAMLGQTLAWSAFGRAQAQLKRNFFGGVDPVYQQRVRRQDNVDLQKFYRDATPETRENIDRLTDWQNVIDYHQDVANKRALELVEAQKTNDPEIIKKAEQASTDALNAVDRMKNADLATRNEYGRLFLTQLARNNQLVNTTLRKGQNNVGIYYLSEAQIFDHYARKSGGDSGSDPFIPSQNATPEQVKAELDAWKERNPQTTATLQAHAAESGFYSPTSGQNVYRPGANPVLEQASTLTFDTSKPSIVINVDNALSEARAGRQPSISVINHEVGHHLKNVAEYAALIKDAEAALFKQEVKDAQGKVIAVTDGLYSNDDLVDLYVNYYLKNVNSTAEFVDFAKRSNLWNEKLDVLDRDAVAAYMQNEITADLNSEIVSRFLGKDPDPIVKRIYDAAMTRIKAKKLEEAGQTISDAYERAQAIGEVSGAIFTPEIISMGRDALRDLEALNGQFSQAADAPEGPKISKAQAVRSPALVKRYLINSPLIPKVFKAQVFGPDGKPVGEPVVVNDPKVSVGSWKRTGGNIEQVRGIGGLSSAFNANSVPEGGSVIISMEPQLQADGKTPVILKSREAKKEGAFRGQLIAEALNTPDEGAPNRFNPTREGGETYRGTLTPLQVQALKSIPDSVLPAALKETILQVNEALQRNDGSRFIVDYAAVMNDNGSYRAFSPELYDVVPIGMMLSKDGNFLFTAISVGRLFAKLNAWYDRMPARLEPWQGSKTEFWQEFENIYLNNWTQGFTGSGYNEKTGQLESRVVQNPDGTTSTIFAKPLDANPQIANSKKNIFADFLNLASKDTEYLNPDRTTVPRRKGDPRGKDFDRTIMSLRVDHVAEIFRNPAGNLPISYGLAKINYTPKQGEAKQPEPKKRTFDVTPNSFQSLVTEGYTNQFDYRGISNPQEVRVDEINPTEGIAQDAVDILIKQMNEGGSFTPIVVDETGNIVDGHHRLEAAKQMGIDRVPVQRLIPSVFNTSALTPDQIRYSPEAFYRGGGAGEQVPATRMTEQEAAERVRAIFTPTKVAPLPEGYLEQPAPDAPVQPRAPLSSITLPVTTSQTINKALASLQYMPKVVVIPERFTGTGQEPVVTSKEYNRTRFLPEGARRGKISEPSPFYKSFQIGEFTKGGKFFDAETKQELTGGIFQTASIDVSGARPAMISDVPATKSGQGTTYKSNLFRKSAGWQWVSDAPPEVAAIGDDPVLVSVEGKNNQHVYALKADFEGGVTLQRYPDKGSEPRLRPTGKGELVLGNEVGRISIRGNEHPVYDEVKVVPPQGKALEDVAPIDSVQTSKAALDAMLPPVYPDIKRLIENPTETPLGDTYEIRTTQPLYRTVSQQDWYRAQDQGFLDSDQRGAISLNEGMNLSPSIKASKTYAPKDDYGIVLKIEPDAAKWHGYKFDQYIRTWDRIPIDKISEVEKLPLPPEPSLSGLQYAPKKKNNRSLRVRMTREALTDAALSQESWKDWYKEHKPVLDDFFGDYAPLFQEILSVTSQAASVKANVGLALKAFGQMIRGEEFDARIREGAEKPGYLDAVIGNLRKIRDKAAVGGRKIGKYKAANEGDTAAVVVDRHIASLIFGTKSPTAAQFAKATQILTEIANDIGWEPSQVQAALWAHSIVKSGKKPQSYGSYLKQLEERGAVLSRIGQLGGATGTADAVRSGRGRYSPVGEAEAGGIRYAPRRLSLAEKNILRTMVPATKLAEAKKVPNTIPEEFKGKPFFTIMADLLGGGMIRGVNMQGGPIYPVLNYDGDKTTGVWASTRSGVQSILTDLIKTDSIWQDANGKKWALIAPFSMSQDAHQANMNFGRVFMEDIATAVKSGQIPKDAEVQLLDNIRNKSGRKALADFPSFTAKNLDSFYKNLSFEDRATVVGEMSTVESKNLGVPSPRRTLRHTRDPSYQGITTGNILSMLLVDVGRLTKEQDGKLVLRDDLSAKDIGVPEHISYDTVIPGRMVSFFKNPIPFEVAMPDPIAKLKEIVEAQKAIRVEEAKNAVANAKSPKKIAEAQKKLAAAERYNIRPDYAYQGRLPAGIKAQTLSDSVYNTINETQQLKTSYAYAQALADALTDNWEVMAGKQTKGLMDFVHALDESDLAETLGRYEESQLRKDVKDGKMSVFKLPKSDVYFGLKTDEAGDQELVGVMNNSGVGGMLNVIMAKAIQEGANKLTAFAVPVPGLPQGKLPTLYGRHGWNIVETIDFDPDYPELGATPEARKKTIAAMKAAWRDEGWTGQEMPPIVVMRHEGIGRTIQSPSNSRTIEGAIAEAGAESGETSGGNRRNKKRVDGRGTEQPPAGSGNVLARGIDTFVEELGRATPAQLKTIGITPTQRTDILKQLTLGTKY